MTAVIYSGNHMSLTRINTKEKLNKHIVVKPEARKKIIPIKKTNKQTTSKDIDSYHNKTIKGLKKIVERPF